MKRRICLLLSMLWVVWPSERLAADLTDELVGYWPFDERAGTNTADASPWGRNGALVNFHADGSQWLAGKMGGALDFAGTNFVVADPMPPPTNTMTFSAWIWADIPSGGDIAVSSGSFGDLFKFGLTGSNIDLAINETIILNVLSDFHGGSGGPLTSLQSWHHVGFVADGNFVSLWQDGRITGQFAYLGNFVIPPPLTQLRIGPGFHGKIDDVAMWLRALSVDEIMDIYEAGLAGRPLITLPSEVVAWGDDSSGQIDVPSPLTEVMAVAGGPTQSFAVKRDGTLSAWGVFPGDVGVPAELTNVVAVASGSYFTVALRRDGTVAVWGYLPWQDPPIGVLHPRPAWSTNVISVAAGDFFELFLHTDGTVAEWLPNSPPDLTNVVAIAAGGSHSLALRADGTLAAWGWDSSGEGTLPGGLSSVVGIAAGAAHNLALKADGTVIAWGDNSHGQTNVPPGSTNITAIAAGGYHSLALNRDGTVIAWGDNSRGQTNVPSGLSNIVTIAAGAYHSLALVGKGSPVLAGSPVHRTSYTGNPFVMVASTVGLPPLNYQWQLNGSDLAGATNGVLALSQVQVGDAGDYTVMVRNSFGTVSRELRLTVVESPPVIFGQPADQMTYPGGGSAMFQVRAEGSEPLFYQWFYGGTQISGANGNTLNLSAVQLVDQGRYSVQVWNSYGMTSSTAARLAVGPVVAWGDYRDNSANSAVIPAKVPLNLTNAVAIAGGYAHSLALTDEGGVIAWGAETNTDGLNTAFGQFRVPPGLTNAVAIAAGGFDSLAVKSDGTMSAWGAVPEPRCQAICTMSWRSPPVSIVGSRCGWMGLSFLGGKALRYPY